MNLTIASAYIKISFARSAGIPEDQLLIKRSPLFRGLNKKTDSGYERPYRTFTIRIRDTYPGPVPEALYVHIHRGATQYSFLCENKSPLRYTVHIPKEYITIIEKKLSH